MPPIGVGASRFASALETGEAKLWVVLLGINDYQDETLPRLRYAAFDCQGISEALASATQAFPQKEFFIHHDLASEKPTLNAIRSSLNRVVTSAKIQDTVLLYFSGHGVLEPDTQQTVLCVADTQKQQLLSTGLCFQDLLSALGNCAAHSQLIWLDACHSGNVSLSGARGHLSKSAPLNPTPQLLELLRQRAAKSRGFYALLSCDQGQQSWEFPDLGHGVFSYYLMRGLRGEAAGAYGIIDADTLYRYVYHQTLQYVEQTNQQLRLINQQKRNKGETDLHPEYSLQTPKRIVEGIGETILGLKSMSIDIWQRRQALIVDGLVHHALSPSLCEVLEQDGNFDLAYFPQPDDIWSNVRSEITAFLQQEITLPGTRSHEPIQPIATRLLYLRGRLESSIDGEAWLFLGDGAWISRAWLRQELRRSRTTQQIVILDCPGATSIEDWIEDLKFASGHGQCILACASPPDEPELFAQVLLEVLVATPAQTGLSMAGLLARLQTNLDGLGLTCHLWLSGTQGLIEMLPAEIEAQAVQRSLTAQDDQKSTLSEIPLTELVDQIRPLLLKSVGPIAPSLLEQVVNSLEERDCQSLIHALSLQLPAKYRAAFEQEANLLQTTIKTLEPVESPQFESPQSLSSKPTEPNESNLSALPKQLDSLVDQAFASSLSTQQTIEIEQFLLELVGPIAPNLLRQLSPAACEPTVMIEELAVYLSAPQQTKLAHKISAMMQSPLVQNQGSQSRQAKGDEAATRSSNQTKVSTADRMVDEEVIRNCEQELTRLIGPIAKFVVAAKRDLENQVSLTTFVEVLIAEIPDAQKAKEFRQKMLKN